MYSKFIGMFNIVLLSFLLPFAVVGESVCQVPMTGTSLFRTVDSHRRHCWAKEELALLYTRRAMLVLLPKRIPRNIPLILEYIQICLTTLRELLKDEIVYDYMVAALADTFGGFLQTYGLPLMHEAYYEGYVSYDTAAEFHRLQENFKSILMTNGEGWSQPMEVRKHINRILPLKVPTAVSSKACAILFTDSSCKTSDESSSDNQSTSMIPLPILDDNKEPRSIAIPLKNRSLYSLKSRSSYDIFIKYYIEASKCITQSAINGLEQSEFDRAFSNWLKAKVFPHLTDEEWYVGFSNVLRIEETIQQRGGMIVAAQPKVKEEESLFSELESETQFSTNALIIAFAVIFITIICICFFFWAFIKRCFLCCARVETDSSVDVNGDPTDTSSLLSRSDDYSATSNQARGTRRVCGHSPGRDTSPSARTVSEESRLTLSCGLGGSRCHRHKH